jgi:hypothetical protein
MSLDALDENTNQIVEKQVRRLEAVLAVRFHASEAAARSAPSTPAERGF